MFTRSHFITKKNILWAIIIILAQALFYLVFPGAMTILERSIFGLDRPLPVFIPLYFVIIYGMVSRHWVPSAVMGLGSWWTAPIILFILGREHSFKRLILATIADGVLFAVIGLLSALLTDYLYRKKFGRP